MSVVFDVRTRRSPEVVHITVIELRRSSAPILAVAVAVTGVILLFVHPGDWVGRWQPFVDYLREDLIIVIPVCAALASWQGGRERRRGLADQLAGSSRDGWPALIATWVALFLAAIAGLLVTFAVGCVFVAPHATYSGGGWWWVGLGCLPPISAALALGLMVGRRVASRVAGLVVAVVLYVVQALPDYLADSGRVWLEPIFDGVRSGDRLGLQTHLLQALWFGGLSVLFLAVASFRSVPTTRSRTVLVAAVAGTALTLAGGLPIIAGPGEGRWVPDPAALRPVCAPAFPRVCVSAVDAYVLPDLAPRVDRVLDRLAGVPGAPTRAGRTLPSSADLTSPPADTLELSDLIPDLSGRLAPASPEWGDPIIAAVQNSTYNVACFTGQSEAPGAESWTVIQEVAVDWILQRQTRTPDDVTRVSAALAGLDHLTPSGQRAWMGQVYALRDHCDAASSAGLLATLTGPR